MVIVFDLDGTLYDLYSQPDWHEKLRREDASAYTQGGALCDTCELKKELIELKKYGCEINVVTWIAKNATKKFHKKIRKAKVKWLRQQGLAEVFDKIIVTAYGLPKNKVVKKHRKMVLFDDNPEVREIWNTPKQRISYDEKNIIDVLQGIKKELQLK